MIPKRWEFNNRFPGFQKPVDFVFLKQAVLSHLSEVGPQMGEQIERGMKGTPGVSRVRQAIRYLSDEGVIERENRLSPWRISRRTVK